MPTRPKFSSVAAPPEKPLPLWILYPLFFVAIYLSHSSLLRLPYFWDEAGYYIPAALDFFHTHALIPYSTTSNAHPPLPSMLLAGWWSVCGLAINGTRTFLCMVAAAALLGVFRLARVLALPIVATVVTLLTALYPVWFAQSTLAHADLFSAAFTLWALSFYFERYVSPCPPARLAAVALLFSLAALSKETAIITPIVLGLWEIVLLLTEPREKRFATVAWLAALFAPAIPLLAWYGYHFRETGFVFGNPEFLRYNATANFTLARVAVSLWHRFVHLTVHMNMYVPVVGTIAAVLMPRIIRNSRALSRPVVTALTVVLTGNAVAYSILGGALLTRYLLVLYPLVLLVCAAIWLTRGIRVFIGLTALTMAAFVMGLWFNPPYSIAPEDNLTYADFVVLHQQAIAVIAKQFPYATVLSAWPATAEMQHPELGYTKQPIRTVALDNFTPDQIQKAAEDPSAYDTALIFSTKWTPRSGWLDLGRASEKTDTKYFDYHSDMLPREVAMLLHGEIVWQGYRNGEWAAVLRFPRSNEARLAGLSP